jgi:hypothetical protein
VAGAALSPLPPFVRRRGARLPTQHPCRRPQPPEPPPHASPEPQPKSASARPTPPEAHPRMPRRHAPPTNLRQRPPTRRVLSVSPPQHLVDQCCTSASRCRSRRHPPRTPRGHRQVRRHRYRPTDPPVPAALPGCRLRRCGARGPPTQHHPTGADPDPRGGDGDSRRQDSRAKPTTPCTRRRLAAGCGLPVSPPCRCHRSAGASGRRPSRPATYPTTSPPSTGLRLADLAGPERPAASLSGQRPPGYRPTDLPITGCRGPPGRLAGAPPPLAFRTGGPPGYRPAGLAGLRACGLAGLRACGLAGLRACGLATNRL